MRQTNDITSPIHQKQVGRSRIAIILSFCLLDSLSPAIVTLRYIGPDLGQYVNFFALITLCGIATTVRLKTKIPLAAVVFIFLFLTISVVKMFLLTIPGDYNQSAESAAKYLLSFLMPMTCFLAIYSLPNEDPKTIEKALIDFARRYLYIIIPSVLVYTMFNLSGQITYFGLGVNFHYVTPFFIKGYGTALGFMVLVLITGKRAVLLNFLIQTFVQFSRHIALQPVVVLIFFVLTVAVAYAFQESLLYLLRRFRNMYDIILTLDLTQGLFSIANSWEALVLFGGRLEEVTGVLLYFEQNPGHVWFGSPPGANYIWSIESTGLYKFKSYAHFTWAGYIFRYGIIFTFALLIFLATLMVRTASRTSGLWLVLIGILTSSFFGANMIVSPTTWVMIALATRYGRQLASMNR